MNDYFLKTYFSWLRAAAIKALDCSLFTFLFKNSLNSEQVIVKLVLIANSSLIKSNVQLLRLSDQYMFIKENIRSMEPAQLGY